MSRARRNAHADSPAGGNHRATYALTVLWGRTLPSYRAVGSSVWSNDAMVAASGAAYIATR